MSESYEDIVREHYTRMRGKFLSVLMDRYKNSNMRLEDAENIYQDIFLVIRENLLLGRLRDDTSWDRYIISVGLKMASKQFRIIGKTESAGDAGDDHALRQSRMSKRIKEILAELPEDEEVPIFQNSEAKFILANELVHMPEPCSSIIHLTYFDGFSDKEIVEELGRYKNASSVKAKRWQCMQDLIYRVKQALYDAGIIDNMPERRNKNEK